MKTPKIPKLRRQQITRMTRRLLPQMLIQSISVVVAALLSYLLMTWLISDVAEVRHIYAAAGLEMLGTLGILILVVVPLNTFFYRRRSREVITLSDAIRSVAAGDYKSKIATDKQTQMKPIYEDFNKMCDELASVQILRNDFINNYSHEFKTPIASINGFAELLLEKEMSPEEQRRYIRIIADESARLSKFASNTSLLSKLSSQFIVTDAEEYDLAEQLRQCSIILSPKWMEKDMQFESLLEPVSFHGNKEMMQHLWLNLLDNAVKYTPAGGSIKVELFQDEDNAVVRISDTGEGISDEAQEHLFDPYFQGDSSHFRQGLGLGLSIVKRVVELCDGDITVQSQVSVGSVFTVTLPLQNVNPK